MFNPFKKSENKTESNYPAIVHEIHNEFLNSGDEILKEAECLLKELEQKDLSKGKRLAALGFGKTREAVVAIETENKLATTKQIAELVMYYRASYPNNKFITESQVKTICKKYGLVCGETSMYKGFVPEEKLRVIEKFYLKKEDESEYWIPVSNGGRSELPRYFVTEKDLTKDGVEYFCKKRNTGYVTGDSGDAIYTIPQFTKECINEFKGHPFVETGVPQKRMMNICAPAKDMEIPQGKQVVGYRIQNIPDPVVLQPVKGGYLIVCAWGNEASDENVVNEKMN